MWRDISGYNGTYQVNESGEVRNALSGRMLKQQRNRFGYMTVKLFRHNHGKEYKVHRLVAIAFIENRNNKPQVNHIDCNRQNNCVENLEWVTCKENAEWAVKMGSRIIDDNWRMKIKASRKRKPVKATQIETGQIIFLDSVRAAKTICPDTKAVIDCCKGRRKTAGGYLWEYVESEDSL